MAVEMNTPSSTLSNHQFTPGQAGNTRQFGYQIAGEGSRAPVTGTSADLFPAPGVPETAGDEMEAEMQQKLSRAQHLGQSFMQGRGAGKPAGENTPEGASTAGEAGDAAVGD